MMKEQQSKEKNARKSERKRILDTNPKLTRSISWPLPAKQYHLIRCHNQGLYVSALILVCLRLSVGI